MDKKKLIPSKAFKQIPRSIGREGLVTIGEEIREARTTWFYWWYQTLKTSEAYISCCENNGEGNLKDLYQDFGDVRLQFPKWWIRHARKIFSLRKELPQVETIKERNNLSKLIDGREHLVISIPFAVKKETALRKIRSLIKEGYANRKVDEFAHKNAKRQQVKTKLRKETVELLLNLVELKRYYRNLPNYELGKKAGITLDVFARKKKGEEELLDENIIKRRMTFAVSRYLKQARHLIQNAEQGIFPCITKPKSN